MADTAAKLAHVFQLYRLEEREPGENFHIMLIPRSY
jgi:hypothetical protein